jgi:hypothetical protein
LAKAVLAGECPPNYLETFCVLNILRFHDIISPHFYSHHRQSLDAKNRGRRTGRGHGVRKDRAPNLPLAEESKSEGAGQSKYSVAIEQHGSAHPGGRYE